MLHYLIMIFEKNYPDTLNIQQDISSVPEAAKVKWVHNIYQHPQCVFLLKQCDGVHLSS